MKETSVSYSYWKNVAKIFSLQRSQTAFKSHSSIEVETQSTMPNDGEAPLFGENNTSNHCRNSHWRDILVLSVAFSLIFLAYGSIQNLETTVNSEGDLGTICLGIVYMSNTLFSIIASVVVKAWGSKKSMIVGTTGYWLFVAANFIPSWYTMVPASFYLGFAASILWVGQGTYLTSTALTRANDRKSREVAAIGKFNGIFWGLYNTNQIVGNLITLAVLGSSGTAEDTSGTTLLYIVFLCPLAFGSTLICFLGKRGFKVEEEPTHSSVGLSSSIRALLKSIVAPLLDVKMLLMIPAIAYVGLQLSFVWAEFVKKIVTPALGVSGVGGAMAVYGAFNAVGSLAAGCLTSGLSSITWILSTGCLLQAIIFLWILLKYSLATGVFGKVYPLMMTAALGTGNAMVTSQLSALLGLLFKHDLEGAFALQRVWENGSIAVVFFMNAYISLQAMLAILLAAICFTVAGILYLTLKIARACSSPSC